MAGRASEDSKARRTSNHTQGDRVMAMGTRSQLTIAPGVPLPLGLQECCSGVNLAVFSRHATNLTVLLFEHFHDPTPYAEIELDPVHHRMGDIWHVHIGGSLRGKAYALRVRGPIVPGAGDRFDSERRLLDPYAHCVAIQRVESRASLQSLEARALIVDQQFDWRGRTRPRRPWSETIIYETHVRGLTVHPSSAARHAGQYLGLIEKIPYLKALGITAVELMPVQQFDPTAIERANPVTGERLRHY